jgi:hypothetical protein
MYTGKNGPQSINKDLTNTACIFEQTVNDMLDTKCEWDKTLCTEIQKFYRQYFYHVVSRKNEWQPMTAGGKKNILYWHT